MNTKNKITIKDKKNKITVTKNKDLYDQIKKSLTEYKLLQVNQVSENTPTSNNLNKANVLFIRIEFDKKWFYEVLEQNPKAIFIFYNQALRVFEKHQYYLTSNWDNEVLYGFFGFNEDNDINQLFEIGSILNSYIKVWTTVIKELNLAEPIFKIIIDVFVNVYMSRLPKNFFNMNPLNCNEFMFFYNNNRILEDLKILAFSENAFYISKVLSAKLKDPYQKLLIHYNHEFDLTTATTILNDEFKW